MSEDSGKKNSFVFYLILGLILFSLYYFWSYVSPYYNNLVESIINKLSEYPILNSIFIHVMENVTKNSFLGLFYIFTFMTLFFIPAPVDILYLKYVQDGVNLYILIPAIVIGSLVGFVINYFIGYILGEKVVKKIVKEELFEKFKHWVEKYGSVLFSVALILPVLPAQILSLLYGSSKFSLKKFSIIIAITLLIKFVLFIFLVDYVVYLLSLLPF